MHWQQAAPLLALAGFAWGDEITTATDSLPTGQQGWAPSSSFCEIIYLFLKASSRLIDVEFRVPRHLR